LSSSYRQRQPAGDSDHFTLHPPRRHR